MSLNVDSKAIYYIIIGFTYYLFSVNLLLPLLIIREGLLNFKKAISAEKAAGFEIKYVFFNVAIGFFCYFWVLIPGMFILLIAMLFGIFP